MERDWPHAGQAKRVEGGKVGRGLPCHRWWQLGQKSNLLESSGGFDVDTRSASDSVLAWDPVAEIWTLVGHLAQPRFQTSMAVSFTKIFCQILARCHNGTIEGCVPIYAELITFPTSHLQVGRLEYHLYQIKINSMKWPYMKWPCNKLNHKFILKPKFLIVICLFSSLLGLAWCYNSVLIYGEKLSLI